MNINKRRIQLPPCCTPNNTNKNEEDEELGETLYMTMLRPWTALTCLLLLDVCHGSQADPHRRHGRWLARTGAAMTRITTAFVVGGGSSTMSSSASRQHQILLRRKKEQSEMVRGYPTSRSAFDITTQRLTSRLMATGDGNDNGNKKDSNNPLDFIFNPYESKIPKEVEADIYRAEANTPAAQNRGQRIAGYVAIAMVGVLGAFFNAFLSELRASPPAPDAVEFDLANSAFAWVLVSGITQFLFLNKIGGGILLLLGAGSGLLAETEWDSRRINAEKIWEELQKRRSNAERKQANKLKKSKAATTASGAGSGKTSLGKKKAKRLSALSEVAVVDASQTKAATDASSKVTEIIPPTTVSASNDSNPKQAEAGSDAGGGGLFKGIKDMYEKADAMAASQALLLNKQLEDAGLLEKITDETGLKVVGRKSARASSPTTTNEQDAAK